MITNPYSQVLENMERSEPLIARYGEDVETQVLQSDIAGKIEAKALHILVYGAYNAGKSTLINVLLGDERARVGDIPTTDHVDAYDWSGYRLLDTPGVNAPIRHEQITADQLARTNGVVLVVREGDQDARDVYDRLFQMMTNKKAVFIVLNHQLGSADEVVMLCRRIGDILARLAASHHIAGTDVQALPIYPVNLSTALKGRMRSHEKLLEHSGFTRFADAFADWTRQHDNDHHHLSEVKDAVKTLWYGPAVDKLKELVGAGDGDEIEHLHVSERTLISKKNRLHAAGYRKVEHGVNEIRPDVAEIIRTSESKDEANDRVRARLQPMFEEIKKWLSGELDDVDASVAVTVEAPQATGSQGGVHTEADSSGVRDIVENVGKLVANKENVKSVLLAGRGMKAFGVRDILGLKGKWTSTLDKWAAGFTRLARGGLMVAQVAIAVWDAKRAHDQQEEENQERRRLAVESQQTIDAVCGVLRKDLVGAIDEVIELKVGADLVKVREDIAGITKDSSEKKRHYQEVLDHRNQLESIIFTTAQTEASS